MAAMTTVLKYYGGSTANTQTYELPGSTMSKPKLLVVRRKPASGNQQAQSVGGDIVYATTNPDGEILSVKQVFGADYREPLDGSTTDRDAALVVFRDWVNSDEFTALVQSGSFPDA